MIKAFRNLFQVFNDGQMLGTDSFTLTAGNAVTGTAMALRYEGSKQCT